MELQHFNHNHPLILSEDRSHEADDDEKTCCSACGEVVVSGQTFSCVACAFHLHKKCAEAASQMNHPFHPNHSLNLLATSPYEGRYCFCDFCGNGCENFIYHCSCNVDLHITCALLSYSIYTEKNIEQLIAHNDPLIKEAKCFACWKPLLDSAAYLSLDYSGFFIHKSCVELPLEIDHPSHPRHHLFLQFNSESLPCQICQEIQRRGSLVYCCSNCKFCLHIECVSPSPVIEDTSRHGHPFARYFRRFPFICDACGTSGDGVSYICLTCCITVHKKCISLPRIIKSIWHQHFLVHNYFLVDNEFVQECRVCHKEVKTERGSYFCSCCCFIVHVNCALEVSHSYYELESEDAYEDPMLAADTTEPTFSVIKEIKSGDDFEIITAIIHFGHPHHLVSSDLVKGGESYCCDGCGRFISTSFYHCSQCNYVLHKSCAELPRKKLIWFHAHQHPLNLISNCIFQCVFCKEHCSGFAYKCEYLCNNRICIRCTEISLTHESRGHRHTLLFYLRDNIGLLCDACGGSCRGRAKYRCKECNFNVHIRCTLLPQITRHKCDDHHLTLMYHEDNDYVEHHYCDICEERRDPHIWFYYCAICDISAHIDCVLRNYPFIKRGLKTVERDHPHSLIIMQRDYDYPEYCCKCGKRCFDLALVCAEPGCNYIIHWSCGSAVAPFKEAQRIMLLP